VYEETSAVSRLKGQEIDGDNSHQNTESKSL